MERNSEHYLDPTASTATGNVARTQPMLFNSKPAYVYSPKNPIEKHKTVKVGQMSMEELKPHILGCAKAKMSVKNCLECNPGCVFGQRAKELVIHGSNPEPEEGFVRPSPRQIAAMKEYQAAIASGDVFKYALEHARSSDPKKAKAAAYVRVSSWRKKYGHLIKEPETVKHASTKPPRRDTTGSAIEGMHENIADVLDVNAMGLLSKLNDFRKEIADLERQRRSIDELIASKKAEKEMVSRQIDAFIVTSKALGVKLRNDNEIRRGIIDDPDYSGNIDGACF